MESTDDGDAAVSGEHLPVAAVTRGDLEDFLFLEAALLDEWRLEEWLALFEPGARYWVPAAGAPDDADPATTLFYIADDYHRLTERVKRLKKRTAHAEFPPSRCRRLISNVRILSAEGAEILATSNYVTYRSKMGKTDTYFGHHRYTLHAAPSGLRIARKTTFIDADDLRAQNKVSIIV
jgi:p-cumate 2,3-dioxygenase subunit beta